MATQTAPIVNRYLLTATAPGVSPTGFGKGDAPTMLRRISSLFGRCAQGAAASQLKIAYKPITATAKLTCTSTGTNGDTILLGNVTITIVTSGATGNQVNVAADGTALATAIVALVNTSSSFTGICTATNPSAGVVLLAAALPGTIGNGLQLSENSTSITLTNAWGALTAGTEGTAGTFSSGV